MQTMTVKRWSVSELTRYVRQMFDLDYRLQDLEVEGEVSNFRIPGSGHAYFTLKDADAQLRCVMWRDAVQAQETLPRDGERAIARGHLSVYEAGGQYQLYCRTLHPAGRGDLYARFEALKARLQAEGLFAPERKRPLPEQIRVIGVATGAQTAALQDVLNVLGRRNPLARVILAPTPVQGDQAPPRIVAALETLNRRDDVDVILLVRGGGSLEDLWCFNDERVARAVADSRVPVITGVGHEIDFTLADFAADLRAPTPSAAAELVSPVTVDDLRARLRDWRTRLFEALTDDLAARRRTVAHLAARLERLSPQAQVDSARQAVDALLSRAARAVSGDLTLRRERLTGLEKTLQTMDPAATLARGYAIVYGPDGRVLRRAADVAPGDRLHIRLHEGELRARVSEDKS